MSPRGVDAPLSVPSPATRTCACTDAGGGQPAAMRKRVTDAELHAIAAVPSRHGPPTMGTLVAELRRLRGLILDFDADERTGGCALLDEACAIRAENDE